MRDYRFRNFTSAIIEIAASLVAIVTLGYVYPQWVMSWLVWLSQREARKAEEVVE